MEQQKSSYPRAEGGEGPTTRCRRRVSIKDEYVGALTFTASVASGIAAELSTKANR